jgi:transposase-like protein
LMGKREFVNIAWCREVSMGEVRCPDCGSGRLCRYGKTEAGKQKYRCLEPNCHRQFVAGSDHLMSRETRKLVEGLLAQDIHPKKIASAIPGISLRWLCELRRRMKATKKATIR